MRDFYSFTFVVHSIEQQAYRSTSDFSCQVGKLCQKGKICLHTMSPGWGTNKDVIHSAMSLLFERFNIWFFLLIFQYHRRRKRETPLPLDPYPRTLITNIHFRPQLSKSSLYAYEYFVLHFKTTNITY